MILKKFSQCYGKSYFSGVSFFSVAHQGVLTDFALHFNNPFKHENLSK